MSDTFRSVLWCASCWWTLAVAGYAQDVEPLSLFDGKTLAGWESRFIERWRVEDGAIVAGDEETKIPDNFFLFTKDTYADFEFHCQFRLTGDPDTGLINSGIQFRSEKLENGHARGYQADIGDPEWWGCIYDEHRRNKIIAKADPEKVVPAVKRNDWNEYVIRCEGARSRLWINGVLTVDYTERNPDIPRKGHIAVQIHSGGAAKVAFKDLVITEFETLESPLSPDRQLRCFVVPEGFEVELVASEETGLPKPISVSFDDAGRLWSMTATEYPVDGNDSPAQAEALWKRGGKDRVVVIDEPLGESPREVRTYADGLAMPMGLLPWKNGVILGHGPNILSLTDTDGDGRADRREILVSGFGINDSHLLPHQFTLLPGGMIAMAQGAFNRSQVIAGNQRPVSFDYCKLGRFTPDGSRFEVVAHGLNNIWGVVLNRQGEMFVQEANDLGFSVVPCQIGENFPGIGGQKAKPYAPFAPPTCDFRLGGTGLSGLAISEDLSGGFPDPWREVMLVANPITRSINSVRVKRRDDGTFSMEREENFLTSRDDWFRPIALSFGPDGCLYIVDWYNKIISHNEVSRTHPDRDKTRGRLWRVRHQSQTRRAAPNVASAGNADLLRSLQSDSTWEMGAARRQIVFRQAKDLVPGLRKLITSDDTRDDTRIHASWALNEMGAMTPEVAHHLLASGNRNVRKEGARVTSDIEALQDLAADADPYVRGAAIRRLAELTDDKPDAIEALIHFAAPLEKGLSKRQSYLRDYERYLVRAALEGAPVRLLQALQEPSASQLPVENRLYACLALPPKKASAPFLKLWRQANRQVTDEELLVLLGATESPELRPVVADLFSDPAKAPDLLRAILRQRERLQNQTLEELLEPALTSLAGTGGHEPLVIDVASEFRIASMAGPLSKMVANDELKISSRVAAVRALGRIGAHDAKTVTGLVADDRSPPALRRAAVVALGSHDNAKASEFILPALSSLSRAERELILEELGGTASGSRVLLAAIAAKTIDNNELSPTILERMRVLLPDDPAMDALWNSASKQFARALQLSGGAEDYAASKIRLEGAFTVETWVRLDDGIGNADGILGVPGGADFNFYNSTFRVYGGPAIGDIAVASRPMVAEAWTHLAVSRSAKGEFALYINGEPDNKGTKRVDGPLENLAIGRTTPGQSGTKGQFIEFRIWDHERSEKAIRSTFSLSFNGVAEKPPGLTHYYPHGADPDGLRGGAKIVPIAEAPPLRDEATALEEEAKLAKYKAIVRRGGDPRQGRPLFQALCLTCHQLGTEGAGAAPALDGSGHRDLDGLLRAILFPSAAVEPGYRVYRVETHDGSLFEGYMVKHDEAGALLRFMGGSDQLIPQSEIRRARYLNRSFMLPGLIDELSEKQVADLISYIGTLKNDSPAKPFGKQISPLGIKHSFLVTGPKTALIDENDRIAWQVDEASRDGSALPNGNLLIAHAKIAREYDREGNVVWEYRLSAENRELERATRLENGRTLIVELGRSPQLLEVDQQGGPQVTVPLQPETDNVHMQTRMAVKLDNGNYLVPHLLAFAVKEYTPGGEVVRVIRTDLDELGGREARNWPFTAIPLPGGNVLVNLTNGNKTVEFDSDGKVVWRADNTVRGGLFADPCGAQRLPNGNTVICSYGQNKPGKTRIFEITPDKKVVWEYVNDSIRAHHVHVLTTGGKSVKGNPLR